MMKLTPAEREWLEAYQRTLAERFSGAVLDLIVFGSKARGDDRPDSDLDVLVVIRAGDWAAKDAFRVAGYGLAVGTDAVPSIQVYTAAEWEQLRERGSVFRQAIERDGVPVR
jgi:predicted nucleotidyltransferase